MFRCLYIIFRETFLIYLKSPSLFSSHHTCPTHRDYTPQVRHSRILSTVYTATNLTTFCVLHLQTTDTACNIFNYYNLMIICNNHVCNHFNFIHLIDFVTLAYVRKDSLKMMSINRNMTEYLKKYTLLLIYCASVCLINKSHKMHGTYTKIQIIIL
jgi:hypothetical protein